MTPAATAARIRGPSTTPCPSTTTRAPDTSGTHTSNSEASKACGACISTASPAPTDQSRCPTSPATLPCGIDTPFGTPVEPEVYITYARSSGPTRTAGSCTGLAATAARVRGSSSTTTSPGAPGGTAARVFPVHSTAAGAESASMTATRSAGYAASTGTYAAPAFQTPSSATSSPADRSISTATRLPRVTPRPARYAASRPASASNSA